MRNTYKNQILNELFEFFQFFLVLHVDGILLLNCWINGHVSHLYLSDEWWKQDFYNKCPLESPTKENEANQFDV